MKNHYYYIHVFPNGEQKISSISLKAEKKLIYLILDQLGHSTIELNSFKSFIVNARKKGVRTLVSYNTLYIYVNGEQSEIGENDFALMDFQQVSTQEVLNYIDEAIKFRELYCEGGIPGIIPEPKKDDWVIVPKKYVKEEYWENKTEDE